ncbi:MAG TPA: hypothetical protein VJK53_04230 [Candidatus Paceibacterota bacterium]
MTMKMKVTAMLVWLLCWCFSSFPARADERIYLQRRYTDFNVLVCLEKEDAIAAVEVGHLEGAAAGKAYALSHRCGTLPAADFTVTRLITRGVSIKYEGGTELRVVEIEVTGRAKTVFSFTSLPVEDGSI